MLRREFELLFRVVDFPPTPHILLKIASIKKMESSLGQIDRSRPQRSINWLSRDSSREIEDWPMVGEDRADSPITQSRKQ